GRHPEGPSVARSVAARGAGRGGRGLPGPPPPDVAGICDGAAGGHPSEGEDYLYPSIGPAGGFAPRADVWSDFLEWAACSGCVGADLDAPDRANATGRWSAPEHAWSGPFSRFMDQRGLYCLYAGRPGRCGPPHDVSSLRRYDLDRNVVETRERKFLVVTSAVGDKFRTVSDFAPFLSSLREHYDGPIKMLVGGELSRPVSDYLERHRVEIAATSEGRSWSDFNVYRFEYYSEACTDGYDVCLAVDFGDVTFQSSPFPPPSFATGPPTATPRRSRDGAGPRPLRARQQPPPPGAEGREVVPQVRQGVRELRRLPPPQRVRPSHQRGGVLRHPLRHGPARDVRERSLGLQRSGGAQHGRARGRGVARRVAGRRRRRFVRLGRRHGAHVQHGDPRDLRGVPPGLRPGEQRRVQGVVHRRLEGARGGAGLPRLARGAPGGQALPEHTDESEL
ncbi:hypothetical protein THAOC_01792, partial [Thalassiosira oceanica]